MSHLPKVTELVRWHDNGGWKWTVETHFPGEDRCELEYRTDRSGEGLWMRHQDGSWRQQRGHMQASYPQRRGEMIVRLRRDGLDVSGLEY